MSAAMGGSFRDGFVGGAITGGIAAGLVCGARNYLSEVETTGSQDERDARAVVRHANIDTSASYDTYEKAAIALKTNLSNAYSESGGKWEWGGFIVEKDGEYFLTNVETSYSDRNMNWYGREFQNTVKDGGYSVVSYQHIHPGISLGEVKGFSGSDMGTAKQFFSAFNSMRSFIRLDAAESMRAYGVTPGRINVDGKVCAPTFANC